MRIPKDLCRFICELGHLKRIKHEGWRLFGVKDPESVAEHSLRAAQIGYILAKLEGYEKPEEICTILVFHDMAECRIGDLHRVAKRYLDADEKKVVMDQVKELGDLGDDILRIWQRIEAKDDAGILAKDADLLEMAFTAKEYMEEGFEQAKDWIEKISKKLNTESAKKLIEELKRQRCLEWWQGLKKV